MKIIYLYESTKKILSSRARTLVRVEGPAFRLFHLTLVFPAGPLRQTPSLRDCSYSTVKAEHSANCHGAAQSHWKRGPFRPANYSAFPAGPLALAQVFGTICTDAPDSLD